VANFDPSDNETWPVGGAETVVVETFLAAVLPNRYDWSATTSEELWRAGTRKQLVKSPFRDCCT
jgi:hypothetical protein